MRSSILCRALVAGTVLQKVSTPDFNHFLPPSVLLFLICSLSILCLLNVCLYSFLFVGKLKLTFGVQPLRGAKNVATSSLMNLLIKTCGGKFLNIFAVCLIHKTPQVLNQFVSLSFITSPVVTTKESLCVTFKMHLDHLESNERFTQIKP